MGQGSFDKESFSKAGRVFEGARTKKRNGRLPVGGASRNRHQKEIHKKNKDRLATLRLLGDE
ncbi:hypothetical protein EPO14_01140 [Patescibacteria group bacterium]|nr:MAG: hypothetical protein EPO14_01140 [Patescibacteria group bacterium]